MNLRARSLILVVFGLIVIFSSSKTTQARNQGQSLESPPLAVTTPDITGNWIGFLTQPGGLFSFELSLTQNGSNIQGTSTIRTTGGHYGVMSLNGSISNSTVYLDEIQIIDTSPTPGFRWCIKTLNLTVSSFQSISTLAGNWQDPGCSSGIVQLQRSTDPFIQVGGSWLGTLIQPGTYFSFELDLTQSGSNITGTSTIRSGSGYGIMQLVGFLAGNSLILHETRIIDSNRSYWCIKILNLTYTNTGSAVDLNGTWSAPGCTGGSLSVQKQLPAVTYSISGKVTDENGSALSGVTMSTNSGINTVTNLSGVYTFTSLIASTYVLTPIKSGYHFTPNSQVVDVPPDATNIDFKGITCSTDEWYGEYFDNRDLLGSPILNRCDQDIDFYWGAHSPDSSVPTDNFSVRWSRTIDIDTTGWYHFRAFTDDGLRLYVDGELIIDDWTARTFTEKSNFKKLSQGPHQVVMEYVEWSNDSMAHLTWYRSLLCPDNAIDCSQNLTPMYQTHYPDVAMPKVCTNTSWDARDQTIARYGCLITSMVMALKGHGINTTPEHLNNWLSGLDPDTGQDDPNIPLRYPSSCAGHYHLASEYLELYASEQFSVTLKHQKIDTMAQARNVLLNRNLPVVMKVANGGHYILGIDVTADTLGIYDPHHSFKCRAAKVSATNPIPPLTQLECARDSNGNNMIDREEAVGSLRHATTVSEENVLRGSTEPYFYFETRTEERTPSLRFWVNGVEILLIDTNGGRVGYDQSIGDVVEEIFNSSYLDIEIVPVGAQPNGIIERTLFLAEKADGVYRLILINPDLNISDIGSQSTDFKVDLLGLDGQFNEAKAVISGTLAPGETVEYQVSYTPNQGTITITPSSNQKIYIPVIIK